MTAPKYAPGAEVWVAPDPDGGEYSVVRVVVLRVVEWADLYEVSTGPGMLFPISPGRVFETEADAIEDRRKKAASNLNYARERIAAAEAFLGRPGVSS